MPDSIILYLSKTGPLASNDCIRLAAELDETENARAARFVRFEDRRDYIAAHALVRAVIESRLGRVPVFEIGAHGKPHVAGGGPAFNLSHTNGLVALAVGTVDAIGVDVERHRDPAPLEIADSVFAPPEIAALTHAPDNTAMFYGLWTLKEAVIKATGLGLTLDLTAFAVTVDPPGVLRAPSGEAGGWHLSRHDVGPGYSAALALRTEDQAAPKVRVIWVEATAINRAG